MNRNIAAKYLTTLHRQGQVDLRSYGKVRLYQVCTRVPYHAFSLMSDGVALGVDRLGIIRAVSGPIETVLACQEDELWGVQLKDLNHPFLSDHTIQDQIQRLTNIRGLSPYRQTMTFEDRMYRITLVACIYDDAMTGVGIQITDFSSWLVRSDASIPQTDRDFPLIHENDGFIVCMKPDERIQYANPAYTTYCKTPLQDLIGSSGLPFVRNQDMIRIREAYLRGSLTPDSLPVEIMVVFPDGDIHWQQWTVFPSFKDNTLHEIHLHGKDVTDLKYQEMEIRELRRGISTIFAEKISDMQENARRMSQEIEGRKREEERLKNQISLVSSLLSDHPVVVLETDLKWIITSATVPDELSQIISDKLCIGCSLTDFFLEDNGAQHTVFTDFTGNQGRQFRKISCHIQIRSRIIPVTLSGFPLMGPDGSSNGMCVAIEFSTDLGSPGCTISWTPADES